MREGNFERKSIGQLLQEMRNIKAQGYDIEPDRCPHIIRKQAGDESYDICELNTKSCLIEHGHYECDTWNEIQKEVK